MFPCSLDITLMGGPVLHNGRNARDVRLRSPNPVISSVEGCAICVPNSYVISRDVEDGRTSILIYSNNLHHSESGVYLK